MRPVQVYYLCTGYVGCCGVCSSGWSVGVGGGLGAGTPCTCGPGSATF